MKKIISLILSVALICSMALLFTGCGETSITVESMLKTDENFAGTRVLTVTVPSTIGASNAVSQLNDNIPDMGKYSGSIVVAEVTDTEKTNQITITLAFDSMSDYEDKLSVLLGKDVTVHMAKPDNILTKGTRYTEDFDVSQMLEWVTNVFEANNDIQKIVYDFQSNVIDLNGSLFTTKTRANVNEVEGYEVNKISISTTNSKNDKYDREFVFEISEEVSNELGDDLKYYFDSNTNELSQYSGWTSKGSYEEYQVIFKGLTISELQNVTNQLLEISDSSIVYGDLTNSSTPLSEGLVFEEKLNTMNFMGQNKSMVPVTYQYSVPTNTTYSEGSILEAGSWVNAGTWQDSNYTLEFDTGSEYIHIPDGIQYAISGINFYLNNNSGDSFRRTVDILYAKDNQDGVSYAYNFFKAKNATVSRDETDNNYICRVETEGTALEISKKTVEYFGGGNYMDYDYQKNSFDLSDNTTLIDYINIGYMLTSENSQKPMTYTVTKSGEENINRVWLDSAENKEVLDKTDENGSFVVNFTGGNASVTYNGTIADWGKVTFFIIISCFIVLVAATLIMYFIKKSLKPVIVVSNAPEQTTTFMLKDLNNARNKNKDDE